MTPSVQCRITFRDSASQKRFLASGCQAFADISGSQMRDIRITETADEALRLTVEMPASAFERIVKAGEKSGTRFHELGIVQGKEVLDTYYDIDTIRHMLSKMFSLEDLHAFCRKRFPDVMEQLPSGAGKANIISGLLDTSGQHSRMTHLLVLTKQHDAATHEKYGPYYLTPRSFPSPSGNTQRAGASRSVFRPTVFNLSMAEICKALIAGTVVSTGAIFLLQRVLMIPMHESVSPLTYFLLGTIVLAGILVGETVAAVTRFKRGQLLALISVGCFWLGNILGNALALSSMQGMAFRLDTLLSILLGGLMMAISPLFSLNSMTIAVIGGTVLAYNAAR